MGRGLKVPGIEKGYTTEVSQLTRMKNLVQLDRIRNQENLFRIAGKLTDIIQDFMALNDIDLKQRTKHNGTR